jgi:hypothetical protein
LPQSEAGIIWRFSVPRLGDFASASDSFYLVSYERMRYLDNPAAASAISNQQSAISNRLSPLEYAR